MKKLSIFLAIALVVGMLSGCAGTAVVYYSDCTCPTGGEAPAATEAPVVTAPPVVAEGAVKTGLYIGTDISGSSDAIPTPEGGEDLETNGQASYDVTIAAVLVDDNGVITACAVDSIPASILFDTTGAIASDLTAQILTKNEQGEGYGMKAYAGSKYEWNEQVAAVAAYAVGKTAEELKNGAVNESGKAADADLAATATIYIGGYVDAIVKAVENARNLGAQAGDELRLASLSSMEGNAATADAAGLAQLNADVVALTLKGDVISSCYIDSVQAKVNFDAAGAITTDLAARVQTKNELGEAYGMKAYAGAKYEWNEQAANFAAYITGKTAADVAGIAITETTKPADGTDLAATVTISIGGFQALIAKAAA